jgi:hypothetical protein
MSITKKSRSGSLLSVAAAVLCSSLVTDAKAQSVAPNKMSELDYVVRCWDADIVNQPKKLISLCTKALSQLAKQIKENAENRSDYYYITAMIYHWRALAYARFLEVDKMRSDCEKAKQFAEVGTNRHQTREAVSRCFSALENAESMAGMLGKN